MLVVVDQPATIGALAVAVARYLVGGRGEKPRGWAGDGRHDVLPLSIE